MSEKQPDQADLLKAGKLSSDPKSNVRPIALQVPRVLTVLDLLKASSERYDESTKRKAYCTTGNYELDRITGGFRPGFSWLFGAGTSWGKSSFLIAITDDNIKLGRRVLIVSSEDTEEVYGDRLMVRRARVDATRFRDGKLNRDECRKVADVVTKGEQLPVFLDARRYPVEDLAGHLTKIIAEHKIDLVAFDYVQEFRSKRRFQDERVKFREIASVLRHVTKDAKVAGILFSQLTTDQHTKIPNRNNIRECRDMANAAEVIILGFEPGEDITSNGVLVAEAGKRCLFVDKVKNGPRNRVVPMKWCNESACFDTVHDPETERFNDIVGDQFDDFGDESVERYP